MDDIVISGHVIEVTLSVAGLLFCIVYLMGVLFAARVITVAREAGKASGVHLMIVGPRAYLIAAASWGALFFYMPVMGWTYTKHLLRGRDQELMVDTILSTMTALRESFGVDDQTALRLQDAMLDVVDPGYEMHYPLPPQPQQAAEHRAKTEAMLEIPDCNDPTCAYHRMVLGNGPFEPVREECRRFLEDLDAIMAKEADIDLATVVDKMRGEYTCAVRSVLVAFKGSVRPMERS